MGNDKKDGRLQKLLCKLEDAVAFSAGAAVGLGAYANQFVSYGMDCGMSLGESMKNLLRYPPTVRSDWALTYSTYVPGEFPKGVPTMLEYGRWVMCPKVWMAEFIIYAGAGIALGVLLASYVHNRHHAKQK